MKKKVIYLLGIAFLFSSPLFAQGIELEAEAGSLKEYMQTITAEELKDHLMILASDDYEGRETGQLGQKLAADYIARHFMANELEGPVEEHPNPYYQPINFRGRYVSSVTLRSPNAELELGKDFTTRSLSDVQEEGLEVVFAGYGIEREDYNDFEGLDVEGKGIIVISGEPKDKDGNPLFDDLPSGWRRYRTLARKKPQFILSVEETQEGADSRIQMFKEAVRSPRLSLGEDEGRVSSMPSITIGPEGLAKLLGISVDEYHKAIAKKQKKGLPLGGLFQTSVDLAFEYKDRKVPSENVLGFLEGADLKDEVVVITSHYDHIGRDGDEINNGADDDGSGTVAVLEIANAFAEAAKDGIRPRRSILFMTVTGEEKGLLGSKYYSDNPIFPLEQTVVDLNIDMIGRVDEAHADQPNFVYIIGSDMLSTDLHNISEEVASTYKPDLLLDYKYNSKDDPQRFYYRSDHYNFAKHNIPIIFYFNGTHEDYHRPTDTPDKINYEVLAKRAQLVFATAWEIANRDSAPVVDKAE
jgi:hypothetical protein